MPYPHDSYSENDAPGGDYENPVQVLTTPGVRRFLGIEEGDELPYYAWPGGYDLGYLVADDPDFLNRYDGTLCAKCANDHDFGHTVVAAFVIEEPSTETCDNCGCFLDNPRNDPDIEREHAPLRFADESE